MRKRPSAALVVALLGLFLSLAGTAEAAFIITKNSQVGPHVIGGASAPAGDTHNVIPGSLGTSDLHAGAVRAGKLAPNSVTGTKVADGSLTQTDMLQGLPCVFTVDGGVVSMHAHLVCGAVRVHLGGDVPGKYCIKLPFTPVGGGATLDASDGPLPVVRISLDHAVIVAADCRGTDNALVFTYNHPGGEVDFETFHAVFYRGP